MLGFDFDDDQRMLQRAIRRFAETELAPLVDEAERSEKFPVQIVPKLGRLGYLAIGYPPEYGGMGLGKVEQVIFCEEVGRICAGFVTALTLYFMAPILIFAFGTQEQKRRYAAPTIIGELIPAVAITEPNAGSDVRGIETTAHLEGDQYVINGSKMFITNSPIADYIIVVTYTDKSKGIGGMSLLIVDKGAPGLTVRKLAKDCTRSSETGEVTLQDVRVPRDRLLGEENGFKKIMHMFNSERIVQAARSLGIAQAALEAAVNYSKERVQFGQPIGNFQGIAFKIADMATQLDAARLLTYRAAWLADQEKDYIQAASMAKLFAAEAVVQIARDAVQIHGGYGVMSEFPVSRYARDSKVTSIGAGTSEIQRLIISRHLGLGR